MTTLLKSSKVLELQELDDDVVLFAIGGEGDLSTTAYAFHRSQWEEMGQPTTVTVTLQPGDHLNTD